VCVRACVCACVCACDLYAFLICETRDGGLGRGSRVWLYVL
jgi:hypothetical protein